MLSPIHDPPTAELRVGHHPAVSGRLLGAGGPRTESGVGYRVAGGYVEGVEGAELLEAIAQAGLRGRGGAAFPTAVKLRAVAERPGPRYLVANAGEGEPASVKDRFLVRHRPHLVIDGLARAARAIGARCAYVYVCDREGAASLRAALLDPVVPPGVLIEVVEGPVGYVAGEETAVVRALDGGPAKPTLKPPRPFEVGVDGRPTAVVNVETLANVPLIATCGADWFREVGTDASPGSFLLTLSGAVREPGLYELPLGTPLADAVELAGGGNGEPTAVLMGGFFGGLLRPEALGLALAHDELRAAGSALGCAAVVVLGENECPVAVATEVMSYLALENAKQCGPCIRGTETLRDLLHSTMIGAATEETLARFERVMPMMTGRGVCATPDAAVALVASLLRNFGALVRRHLGRPCARCAAAEEHLARPARRLTLDPPTEGNSGHARRH
jgi:NADH:ubiquinone oxidoreductase subunit F (NADH-binding)